MIDATELLAIRKSQDLQAALTAAGVPATVRTVGGAAELVYAADATAAQRTAGAGVVAGFDTSDAAQQSRDDAKNPERAAVRQQAVTAVQDNNAYLALANPTTAQNTQQLRRLTQQNNALIKRLAQIVN